MSDELDEKRAKNWIRQQLAFERMLEALRSNAVGTSPFWQPAAGDHKDRAA